MAKSRMRKADLLVNITKNKRTNKSAFESENSIVVYEVANIAGKSGISGDTIVPEVLDSE